MKSHKDHFEYPLSIIYAEIFKKNDAYPSGNMHRISNCRLYSDTAPNTKTSKYAEKIPLEPKMKTKSV